jgi:hypothetical protein
LPSSGVELVPWPETPTQSLLTLASSGSIASTAFARGQVQHGGLLQRGVGLQCVVVDRLQVFGARGAGREQGGEGEESGKTIHGVPAGLQ